MTRGLLITGLAALLGACGHHSAPVPATGEPQRIITFRVFDEDQANRPVTDFLAGKLYMTGQGGRVLITERLVRRSPSERPRTIAAGFAYGDRRSNDWRVRRKGRSVALGRLSASAADTLRDTLIVELPRSADLRLGEHWLFFEIWGEVRPRGSAKWVRAFRSLHSRPDIFVAEPR